MIPVKFWFFYLLRNVSDVIDKFIQQSQSNARHRKNVLNGYLSKSSKKLIISLRVVLVRFSIQQKGPKDSFVVGIVLKTDVKVVLKSLDN